MLKQQSSFLVETEGVREDRDPKFLKLIKRKIFHD